MSSKMTVKKEAIMARFGGMGFHNSEANVWREMDDVQFNQYVGKVYRELSPGFSRMWGGFPEWTKEEMDAFAEYCEKMQCKVGATIYLTGHCVRYETDEELTAYASNVADRLEYLIYEKGLSNVKIYCMSNELSLDDWGDLAFEMATFKKYHTYLYNEFAHRHLPVYLLATDASPMERWETVEGRKVSTVFDAVGEIVMPGGHMTVEQLTALLNTIPMEITFVDADNINRFFNEGPKVFKRPGMAIDREVFSCHPPKIEPMVRQIIDDFRNNRRDEVPVWMEKGGRTMLVKYMAVRDNSGAYLGTVELVQDMEFAKTFFLGENK